MTRTPDEAPRIALDQAGAFTARQAIEAGWTARQVERRVARGRWRRVAGSAFTVDPGPDDAARLGWAALLTWPEAVVGRRVAAVLHGFPVDPGDVEVYSPAGRAPGRRLVPVRLLVPPGDRCRRAGVPVTSRTLTAVDCLGTLPWSQACDLYAWLSTRDVLDHDALAAAVRSRYGRPGTAQLRALLTATRDGAVSAGERVLLRLLRGAGIRGWRAGVPVRDGQGVIGVADVLFERERLVLEVDGERAHSGREAFVRDRRRQNRLVNAGFRVLRFTWWDLVERPGAVLSQVRSALHDPGRIGFLPQQVGEEPDLAGITGSSGRRRARPSGAGR